MRTSLIAQPSLSEQEKIAVIQSVSKIMQQAYVFPNVGQRMATQLTANLTNKLYRKLDDPVAFAARLTDDLVSVSHDKHIRVFFDPEWVKAAKTAVTKQDSLAVLYRDLASWKKDNFGFKAINVLPGNIGYLKLDAMMDVKFGGETGVAAMNYLSNVDALIIDLRENHGGSNMGSLIASYLFDGEPVQLAELHLREGNKIIQEWTLAHVPGKRMPDTPVYILTSNFTFSAAEAIAQRLKVLKRAITIGEKSGGGAHITEQRVATDRFCVFVPFGRSIGDPTKETDWEGVGVIPDISVPANDAFDTAYQLALSNLSKTSSGSTVNYQWYLENANAKATAVSLPVTLLDSYAGDYADMKIRINEGRLTFQKGKQMIYRLTPINSETFLVEGMPYLRLKFIKENNRVSTLIRVYDNGMERKSNRVE
ncbi:S41 family peptidase [Spirosoma foliorum]|uniref:S41 family peptidase n=1 Tax=Spirosoma foliorum TaxID=2710596 RepID=A0A7G5GUF2_9BACT|nr:S41 family peptidase [Spirosoma foliorum]QMW02494.1 S41 family peptidase [Spirosoma foliorum]